MSTAHITPVRTYVTVWICLVAFTVITVLVAAHDFERLNSTVALGIAVTKATLVILFFMGVRFNTPLTRSSWCPASSGGRRATLSHQPAACRRRSDRRQ
jgi:caa(3)-type oxidase subunit IV